MSGRRIASIVAGLATLLLTLAGCDFPDATHEPPENSVVGKAVGVMYTRAGLANEVSSTKILGKHYRPAQDSWKVVTCVEFVMSDADTGRDCNDSFELFRMDSGAWMVTGTVNGAYRWLELPLSELTNPGS